MNPVSTQIEETSNKRPRSASEDLGAPTAKAARTQSNYSSINYLSRQNNNVVPLITSDETLPNLNNLINEYEAVLQRQESLALNMGARPIGPILVKRFERLFDGPPRILKTHRKNASVTWLDVVKFAKAKPEQFSLETSRSGIRVCQFYTKQCRVEISEEDFMLIASGMPQKLIPPQPIQEDEDKELAILETIEQNIDQIVNLARQVSTRARDLGNHLKVRRSAIVGRQETKSRKASYAAPQSPLNLFDRKSQNATDLNGSIEEAENIQPPSRSFTAVNARPTPRSETIALNLSPAVGQGVHPWGSNTASDNAMFSNESSSQRISQEQRVELIKTFLADDERRYQDDGVDTEGRASLDLARSAMLQTPQTRSESSARASLHASNNSSAVAIPSTPASLLPHSKPNYSDRDNDGPYKAEMVVRMESLHRGDPILPPCDRCRRLQIDCLKNLTACMGCTRKHAKCSWKDVRDDELRVRGADGNSETGSVAAPDVRNDDHSQYGNDKPSNKQVTLLMQSQDAAQEGAKDENAGLQLKPAPNGNQGRRVLDLLPPPSPTAARSFTPEVMSSVSLSGARDTDAANLPPSNISAVVQDSESQQEQHQRHHVFSPLSNPAPTLPALPSPRAPTPNESGSTALSAVAATTMTVTSRSPSIGQQFQDVTNGPVAAYRSVFMATPFHAQRDTQQHQHGQYERSPGVESRVGAGGEQDKGDRLQALAAQVYRSASAQQQR